MRSGRIAVAVCALSLGACVHGEKSFEKFTAAHQRSEILPVAFVAQESAADCGAAALTSVGRFWGLDVASGAIAAERAPANPAFGYSVGELRDASARLGLASSRLLEQPDYVLGLVGEGMPVIAPIAKPYERRDVFDFMLASVVSRWIVSAFVGEEPTVNHYVVLLGADESGVYFVDPQDGYRAMERAEFVRHWNDLTLKFVPDAGESVAAFVAWRDADPAPHAADESRGS
jgi:hypothetical protein